MNLIHQVKDDIDGFVVHLKCALEVYNEACACDFPVRKTRSGRGRLGKKPLLFEPKFDSLGVNPRRLQKFLLAHGHGETPSRGLNALPLAQFETNASSSGSGALGSIIFNLTSSSRSAATSRCSFAFQAERRPRIRPSGH